MKILYYDCFAGISGDMNLAAMIDLGIDADFLKQKLTDLNIDEEFELEVSKDIKMGISGTKVTVHLKHKHHHHQEDKKHHHQHAPHRNVSDIEKIIDGSDLSSEVKKTAKEIFMHVALAEAKVHAKPLSEIHFHEVGATDSIVDIVGAAICIHELKVDKVISRPVELGGGFVKCAHGVMPVPAPATAEIVKNIPTTLGAVKSEATTPTGAAILKTIVGEFSDSQKITITKTGYGIGHRDAEIPNVLRVYLAESEEIPTPSGEARLLECNVDDMNPELLPYLMEKLFEQGASDVHFTPIIMKKNRPAIKVTVLCESSKEQSLSDILLTESTSIGVKKIKIEKQVLKRETITIETSYGKVEVKKVWLPSGQVRLKPEFEDVSRIARSKGEPLINIYGQILNEISH